MLDNGQYKGVTTIIQGYALKCKQKPSDAVLVHSALSYNGRRNSF